MARLRIGGVDAATVTYPRLRIGGVGATGDGVVPKRLRIGGVGASGTAVPALKAFTAQHVQAFTTVTITADLEPGSITPDGYTWTVVSGAPVTITGTGQTVTVVAPAGLSGTTTTIRCTPRIGSTPGVARDFTLTTPTHMRWKWATGGTLVPVRLPSLITS